MKPQEHNLTSCVRRCGRTRVPGKARCVQCLEKKRAESRKLYQERVSRGVCAYCVRSAEVGIFCFTHWLKNVGVSHGLGNKKGIAVLLQLWNEQSGRCAVTGEKLIPGLNASLDHIVPKSRGGLSEKTNLRWVLLRINQLKWDMTHEEFVEMCRLVVREQDRRCGNKETSKELMRSN